MSVVATLLSRGAESTAWRSACGLLVAVGLVFGAAGLTGCSSVDSDPEEIQEAEEELEVGADFEQAPAPADWSSEPGTETVVPTLGPLDALETQEVGKPGEDRSVGPGQGQEPDPHPWFVDSDHDGEDDYSNAS